MKTKNIYPILSIFIFGIIAFLTNSCKEDLAPAVSTFNVNYANSGSAELAGTINDDGGATVTTRGFCWSRFSQPTIEDDTVNLGSGSGSFTYVLTNLIPGTKYFYRAFAINSIGISYGSIMNFTTKVGQIPVVTTNPVTNKTQISATSGGEITFDDKLPILQKGVCWATTNPPTILNDKTTEGPGNEKFESTLTNLNPNTTYYCRAYATNIVGTGYGPYKTFFTLGTPIVTTNSAISYTQTSAEVKCNVTTPGTVSIHERGVCWSIGTTPTTSDSKTFNGTGKGTYTCMLNDLLPGTTYNVRAFASNIEGTGYGVVKTVTTMPKLPPVVTTNAVINITLISASCGGNVSSGNGALITDRGVCWSTNPVPTISDNKTTDGNGTGDFTSYLTGLTSNTTYYVRAYATNSAGTSYGATMKFFTFQGLKGTVTDIESNVYPVVYIGDQIWMAENLKTTKLNDGTDISHIIDNATWTSSTSPAYCYYNDDTANKNTYGCLYKWETVNTGKLCPSGWHVPSDAEWQTLTSYLITSVGGKIKETGTTHWKDPNTGADNSSGFNALPGGYRKTYYAYLSTKAYWWSSTPSGTNAYCLLCVNNSSGTTRMTMDKKTGLSVRCVKD